MRRWHVRLRRTLAQGFTLIEVLVALGIVAIALAAGLQATGSLARNAQRQSDVMLAQLCAENVLVQARLSQSMPSVGSSSVSCEQAGLTFDVTVNVQPTPNPSFRRVTAQVNQGSTSVLSLSAIIGRY